MVSCTIVIVLGLGDRDENPIKEPSIINTLGFVYQG
jgi:hypothetical protein